MIATPEEARELWCPMVRIARRETERPSGGSLSTGTGYVVGGCNTDALGGTRVPASCRCIAASCAMWRWAPSTTTHHERKIVEKLTPVLVGRTRSATSIRSCR